MKDIRILEDPTLETRTIATHTLDHRLHSRWRIWKGTITWG